jgi:hypothetical protein
LSAVQAREGQPFYKGENVGYHDRQRPDYMSTGIGVVNPLHEQQKKLNQLKQFLKEMAEETDDLELKNRIEAVLK